VPRPPTPLAARTTRARGTSARTTTRTDSDSTPRANERDGGLRLILQRSSPRPCRRFTSARASCCRGWSGRARSGHRVSVRACAVWRRRVRASRDSQRQRTRPIYARRVATHAAALPRMPHDCAVLAASAPRWCAHKVRMRARPFSTPARRSCPTFLWHAAWLAGPCSAPPHARAHTRVRGARTRPPRPATRRPAPPRPASPRLASPRRPPTCSRALTRRAS
jgi:hypothetical protein